MILGAIPKNPYLGKNQQNHARYTVQDTRTTLSCCNPTAINPTTTCKLKLKSYKWSFSILCIHSLTIKILDFPLFSASKMETRHYYEREGFIALDLSNPKWPGPFWGLADYPELPWLPWRKGAGIISRWEFILKVTPSAETSLQMSNPFANKHWYKSLSWAFRRMPKHMVFYKRQCLITLKTNFFWCLTCISKVTDWPYLVDKIPTWHMQKKGNEKRRDKEHCSSRHFY